MTPGKLTAERIRRYRAIRSDGVSATLAYCGAQQSTSPSYSITHTGAVVFDSTARPDLPGCVLMAQAEPDPDPDVSWLGQFTDLWSPDALIANRDGERHTFRYFHPHYTIAQRRADYTRQGYSRGVAQYRAEQDAHLDMEHARRPEHYIVTVAVYRDDIQLGAASLGDVDFHPTQDQHEQLAELVVHNGLIDDAVDEALTGLGHRGYPG